MTIEQAFGEVSVYQVRQQAAAFGFIEIALVFDRNAVVRRDINAGLDAGEGTVPCRAETDRLGEKFIKVAGAIERSEWILACYPECRVEPFAEWCSAIGESAKNLFPLVKHFVPDFSVILVQFIFGFVTFLTCKAKGAFGGEQQAHGLFATESKPFLHDVAVDLYEPRVLSANLAEGAFSKVLVYFTEVAFVKEWAAVVGEQLEVPVFNTCAEPIAKRAFHFAVGPL